MDAARAIRILRGAHHLTQRELADVLELSPAHVSLLESGKRRLGGAAMNRLLDRLAVPAPLFHLMGADEAEIQALGGSAAPLAVELVRYIAARTPKEAGA